MRGFGHIKDKNIETAKEREATLLAAYRSPALSVGRRRIAPEKGGTPALPNGVGGGSAASLERANREGRVCGGTFAL